MDKRLKELSDYRLEQAERNMKLGSDDVCRGMRGHD